MSIYDEMQGVASELLGEFKQGIIQYIRIVPGSGPVDNPGPSTQVATTINATARGVDQKYVGTTAQDGKLIVATDKTVVMPADTVKPDITGFVSIDGKRAKVMSVEPRPAAGVAAVYILVVRA